MSSWTLSSPDRSASRRNSLARTCRMSLSYARTATYSAVPSRNTLTTVRSVAGAPTDGSRCRKSMIESAPAHAEPPSRPSKAIGTLAVTTAARASAPCCAAVWTGTHNVSVRKARSLSMPCIDCRSESAQHIGERAVGPEVDVVQMGGITNHMAVQRGGRDSVCAERAQYTGDAGVAHREVAGGDRTRRSHHMDVDRRSIRESGGHRAATHG